MSIWRLLLAGPVILVVVACSAITGPATWTYDPGAEIGPDTTQFTAWVTETACASGQSSKGRIIGPEVKVSAETIMVTFRVRSLVGGQDCQGNPSTAVTVRLPEALGERQLVDGGREPPAEPRTCAGYTFPGSRFCE